MTSTHQRSNRLISTVLIIGMVVALLSYLFHPDVGQFSLIINGQPIAEPLVRLAAIPTVLIVMLITGVLTVLLFLGIGVALFFASLFFALLGIAIIAPYFWPILVVIFLIIALMSFGSGNKN